MLNSSIVQKKKKTSIVKNVFSPILKKKNLHLKNNSLYALLCILKRTL